MGVKRTRLRFDILRFGQSVLLQAVLARISTICIAQPLKPLALGISLILRSIQSA